jgi:hypothetical protein
LETVRVAISGAAKPRGRQAGHVPLAGDAGTTPWTLPLDERGIRDLTGYAHTACLLLTAALTGMRESELMELRHGCRSISRHGDSMTRYRTAPSICGCCPGPWPANWPTGPASCSPGWAGNPAARENDSPKPALG